jgi:hypothetical protein
MHIHMSELRVLRGEKSKDLQTTRHAMAETTLYACTYTRVSCECCAVGRAETYRLFAMRWKRQRRMPCTFIRVSCECCAVERAEPYLLLAMRWWRERRMHAHTHE